MNDSLTHRLISRLPPRAHVLDLGCGTGRHAHALARAGFRVTGLDLDLDALETARFLGEGEGGEGGEGGETPGFVAGDLGALPFADASFDAVLCADVLHWSRDARAFVAAWDEAWRVLRPGGAWASRLRTREESPGASALGAAREGRHRLADGGEWFLADRAALEARAAGGEWVEAPAPDGDSATFILRKASAPR